MLKTAPSGREELNRRHATLQGPWASPSNVCGLRPGRPHNLPQVRFLSLQVFVARTVRMPQQRLVSARTSTSVPRTRFSFSAFAFTVTHIVKVTGKGATTTLPIPSLSHPCSWRRDRRSKLRKARRTKHENKESISIKLSLLILNLEEGDITLLGLRSLKTKVLPVAAVKWSSATLARLVVGSRHYCHVSSQRRCQTVRPRGRPSFQVWCPRHLREQPPFFARAKKAQKITEYRDTAPLTTVLYVPLHVYRTGKHTGNCGLRILRRSRQARRRYGPVER